MGAETVIEFAWPYIFLLLPLPWLVWKLLPPSQDNQNAFLMVPELADFESLNAHVNKGSSKLKQCLLLLFWMALLLSAARPQWIGEMIAIPQSGRDLMLAVDLSGSMQIKDFEINGQYLDRLSALKVIVSDFIERRKGDRIGLIVFGSQAYLQVPLTFDIPTVKQLLMETAVGLAGNETAMGDAIGLAVKQLMSRPQASRVLILITDGNNNAGELTPEKAAEIAAHENLKIHTIAIGAKPGQNRPLFGNIAVFQTADIDEKALKQVAEKTGGQYFRAYNSKELAKIYQLIDQLEGHEQSNQYYRPIQEIYYWPLAVALLCLGLLLSYEWKLRWQK